MISGSGHSVVPYGPDAAVEGCPHHHPGMREVLCLAPHLPQSTVPVPNVFLDKSQQKALKGPGEVVFVASGQTQPFQCHHDLTDNVGLELSDEARAWLAREGYDPDFGARPLKRLLQRSVVAPLSRALLEGRFAEGSTVRVELVEGDLRASDGAESPFRLMAA